MYKKIPKKILVLDYISKNVSDKLQNQVKSYLPNYCIHFVEHDIQYDLIYLSNYIFKFDNLVYYNTISTGEIIHKRAPFSFEIFLQGLFHYSECNIRNGV